MPKAVSYGIYDLSTNTGLTVHFGEGGERAILPATESHEPTLTRAKVCVNRRSSENSTSIGKPLEVSPWLSEHSIG